MKIPGTIINHDLGITCNVLDCPERRGGMCHFDPRYQEENPELQVETEIDESKNQQHL